jgi:hypothetical protein
MRWPARVMAATALAAASLEPLSVAARAAAAQPSLPSALASFLTDEAHAACSNGKPSAEPPSDGSRKKGPNCEFLTP